MPKYFNLSRMSYIVNTSSGGFLYGGSGFVYGVAPRVLVHRPVCRVVRPRPVVRHVNRVVHICALCHRIDGVKDSTHTSHTCPYH